MFLDAKKGPLTGVFLLPAGICAFEKWKREELISLLKTATIQTQTMGILTKIFGGGPNLKKYYSVVDAINALEARFSALSDEALKEETVRFRDRLAKGETLDSLLPEAFAATREGAKRTLGLRHYDVQLIGGQILHEGAITEMRTGEGKTLVATLPAYLNALTGKGVHIVTVNDYLARRDAVWMGQVYAALGVSVSVVNHDASYIYDPSHREKDTERDAVASFRVVYDFLKPCSRAEAYAADITYGTNSEFGFDYLRDNLAYGADRVFQRPHHYAIVDEVDSILIDEARTPLIISAPVGESESLYGTFAQIAQRLVPGEDYTVDEKLRAIAVTEVGIEKAEKTLGVDNIYTEGGMKYVHHLETAIRAEALYKKEREYVVKDGEVIIVDESTGRLQPGRRWSEGLHQAIEAKEGVEVKKESRTMATISYQNYFRLYEKLSGMTGTALTSAEEFEKVYHLQTIAVPTNKPSARNDLVDLIYQSELGKFQAIANKVKELNEKGQPVLVGTISIERNELLSEFLKRQGVRHEILNAKNHEREGEIIAGAGKRGAVTIATNMAGRGIDIKLGGPAATPEEYEEVKALGGLFVLGTERHEARRIDNQLRGRAGRQGDPGTTQFYVSLEDALMRIFGSGKIKNMMGRFGIPEDQPIESRLVSRSIEGAQEKVEGLHFDARKHLLEYDDVMNFQRKIIYERRRSMVFGTPEEVRAYLDSLVGDNETLRGVVKERQEKLGGELFTIQVRQLILQAIDMYWVEHLEAMEYMRSSVRLRAYGQRDPLVEYKREGLRLFKEMETTIEDTILRTVPNLGVIQNEKEQSQLREIHESASLVGNTQEKVSQSSEAHDPRISRNDPCPCGSGKKWKNCGLINALHHKVK